MTVPTRSAGPSALAAGLLAGSIRLLTGVRAEWTGDLPTTEQRVYYANHSSHLDFLVLWAALPPDVRAVTRPVAAADYWSSGIRAWLAKQVFRAVLVDRGVQAVSEMLHAAGGDKAEARRQTVRPLLDALAEGSSLVFFPEGTRGNGYEVSPFRSGLHTLCEAVPGLKLVPAYLGNLSRMLPKGEVLPVPLVCTLQFGPCVSLAEGENRKKFLDRAREALCTLRRD